MRAPLVAVAAGLVAVVAGVIITVAQDDPGSAAGPRPVPVVDRGTVPAGDPSSSSSTARSHSPDPSSPPMHHTVPAGTHLVLSRLHVDAPVVPVRVRDSVMGIPRDPRTLGWWRGGAGPGDRSGSVVVVGHINYAGVSGALAVLPDARPGDVVTLTGRRYRVAAVRTYPKTSGIPQSVFRRDGAPQLVLITCGGPFDPATGNYEDNIVVYAVPAG